MYAQQTNTKRRTRETLDLFSLTTNTCNVRISPVNKFKTESYESTTIKTKFELCLHPCNTISSHTLPTNSAELHVLTSD